MALARPLWTTIEEAHLSLRSREQIGCSHPSSILGLGADQGRFRSTPVIRLLKQDGGVIGQSGHWSFPPFECFSTACFGEIE
jgi:hypothetical protein